MSESELLELKEQIKQEVMAEMEIKKKNESNWAKIKKEYQEEFEKFKYERYNQQKTIWELQSSIGGLLNVLYKAENVSKIKANYEDMKLVVEKILTVLNEKRKEIA